MSRYRASAIHLGISVAILATSAIAMLSVWYPAPLFEHVGGKGLLTLLFVVDATLGPLLTLIVFDNRKKLLWLDLGIIAILQLTALVYGLSTMFEARPVYIVFVKDRFELVKATDIDPAEMQKVTDPRYVSLPMDGPKFISVRFPTERKEADRIFFSAIIGSDIQNFPQYYRPYEEVQAEAAKRSSAIGELSKFNAASAISEQGLDASLEKNKSLAYLPLKTKLTDLVVLLDRTSGRIERIVDLRPWDQK